MSYIKNGSYVEVRYEDAMQFFFSIIEIKAGEDLYIVLNQILI